MSQLHLFRETTYCRACYADFLVDDTREGGDFFCEACYVKRQQYRRVFDRPMHADALLRPTLRLVTKFGVHESDVIALYQYTHFVRALVDNPEYRVYAWSDQDEALLTKVSNDKNIARATEWSQSFGVYYFAENYAIDYDAIRQRKAEIEDFWQRTGVK